MCAISLRCSGGRYTHCFGRLQCQWSCPSPAGSPPHMCNSQNPPALLCWSGLWSFSCGRQHTRTAESGESWQGGSSMETQQVETWGTARRGNGANNSMATTLCCFDMGCVRLLILGPNLRVQNAYNKKTYDRNQFFCFWWLFFLSLYCLYLYYLYHEIGRKGSAPRMVQENCLKQHKWASLLSCPNGQLWKCSLENITN